MSVVVCYVCVVVVCVFERGKVCERMCLVHVFDGCVCVCFLSLLFSCVECDIDLLCVFICMTCVCELRFVCVR